MNIFTTVMSGAPEQLFPLLDKTQQLLIMTDKNIVGLDCIRSFFMASRNKAFIIP